MPCFQWYVGTLDQFVPYLFEKTRRALRLDALKRHAVNSRCAVIGFR